MFDYTSNARHHQTTVCTKELFKDVLNFTSVGAICADIKDALEKVKRGEMSRADFETYKRQQKIKLPAFLFQAHFKDGIRHNSSAESSGLSIFDIDHISAPDVYFKERIESHIKETGIVLAHITPSTEGLRLVFKLQAGETPQQAQQRLAHQLNLDTFDEACKDMARCSFAVPVDYILFEDDEGLWAPPLVPPSSILPLSEGGKSQPGEGVITGSSTPSAPNASSKSSLFNTVPVQTGISAPPLDGGGVGVGLTAPTPQNLKIFDEVVAAAGLSLENLNNVGTRHNSLISILSIGIGRLMPIEQLQAVVAKRMPDYSNEKDCQDLIRDFYGKYTDPSRPMSMKLRKIFTQSLKDNDEGIKNTGGTDLNEDIDPESNIAKEDEQQKKIIELTENLPSGLRESLDGVPVNMKMPVLCSILPLAAAYADGVRVRYCDGAEQRLGLMSVIIGPQASGKSSCSKKVALWERQMKEEDAKAREIEDEWKEAKKSRKANEKAPEDPCVLVRSVPATISCSTLLKRFKNSRGHTLWTFCSELDTLTKTNGAGSWSSKYDIYRLGFDYDEWGQDYNSDQAVSGVVRVAYNFSILGTYGALRRCFKSDNIENGLSSRIILAEMPDTAFAPMPAYGQTSLDASEAIDKAVTLLRSKTGFFDTPKLRAAIGEWVEQKRLEAMAGADLVKDTYRKRAAVIGFRCGVVAMLLEGEESNNVVKFATTMSQYVLDEQLKIFGKSLQAEFKKAADASLRQGENNNIFDSLPIIFTLQNLQEAKGALVSRTGLQMIISRWKKSGWIKKTAVNQWTKMKISTSD